MGKWLLNRFKQVDLVFFEILKGENINCDPLVAVERARAHGLEYLAASVAAGFTPPGNAKQPAAQWRQAGCYPPLIACAFGRGREDRARFGLEFERRAAAIAEAVNPNFGMPGAAVAHHHRIESRAGLELPGCVAGIA